MHPAFVTLGGHPALDFLNTLAREGGAQLDRLGDAPALVAWLRAAGLLSAAEADALPETWLRGAAGGRLVAAARALRASLREGVTRALEGRPVGQGVADTLNPLLAQGGEVLQARAVHGRLRLETRRELAHPEALLRPVALAGAELLAGDALARVRRCDNPDCILLFLDTTKNRTRRWCSMAACGNRMKARAHRARS